jgi:PKD repeat protein
MWITFKKFPVSLIIAEFLGLIVFSLSVNVSGQEIPVIRIIDSVTGSQSISLGNSTEPMPEGGFILTVNVTLNGLAKKLYTYQIGVKFNTTIVKCTGASIPDKDPNFVFHGKTIQKVKPSIGDITPEIGYVVLGASIVNLADAVDVSQGIFCQINFTAIKTGATTIEIIPTTDNVASPYYGHDTFLWDSNLRIIEFVYESFSVTITAIKTPPVTSFMFYPQNPKPNQTITFDASASFDPDGEIVSYFWDFGDGTNETAINANITHIFAKNGLFSVNLTVYDNDGLSSSAVVSVQVGMPPIANFTYEPTENIMALTTNVMFNASASFDPDGEIVSYFWDFGDGTNETAINANITHIFAKNGLFSVNLTVYDNDGLSSSTFRVIMVGTPPHAEFTFSPEFPAVNESVTFDASLSYDEDGYITLLVWNFGEYVEEFLVVNVTDPNISEPFITRYNYTGSGAYPVTLTVYDNDGLYSSIVQVVNVTSTGGENNFGSDITPYVITVVAIGVVAVAAVWYKRRPEKELDRRHRYRVI